MNWMRNGTGRVVFWLCLVLVLWVSLGVGLWFLGMFLNDCCAF